MCNGRRRTDSEEKQQFIFIFLGKYVFIVSGQVRKCIFFYKWKRVTWPLSEPHKILNVCICLNFWTNGIMTFLLANTNNSLIIFLHNAIQIQSIIWMFETKHLRIMISKIAVTIGQCLNGFIWIFVAEQFTFPGWIMFQGSHKFADNHWK